MLCRGLKFAFPQKVSTLDVKASFEKAYWSLEPTLPDDLKELTAATVRSVALNYAKKKDHKMPKAILNAINLLKRMINIVITKPDKGNGVVIMNKSDYLQLLAKASVDDITKLRICSAERPKRKGRPPKNYHPLFEKEKKLQSIVQRILPKHLADSLVPK